MYVLALSDYKQLAAAAGYKPSPQLGRQTAVYRMSEIGIGLTYILPMVFFAFMFHFYVSTY